MTTAIRYHDISCGHRVVGHESKCRFLHGHNYRFTFHITAANLDDIGRILDFSVIKSLLCEWLEQNYDHKFLIWSEDPFLEQLRAISPESVYEVSFNPTAENIAENFVLFIAPLLLKDTGCKLIKLDIEETRKCSVSYVLNLYKNYNQ